MARETTEEIVRRVVAETHARSAPRADTPRWRVIVEVVIAAGVIGLLASRVQDAQFQSQVESSLHYLKTEVNAIQAKVQAPFPSDPPSVATNADPPRGPR